ncbi:MAG: aromatic-ring-hydroxylating dioxygenase subunit beta [Immundisolibacteraceae bacterium]|nr:aromatic-ring-hydroxylating dioxygenase subunit beta [Immundisolibacteraceae bacterium]
METQFDATAIATQLLYRESKYLDQRNWNGWLGLYADDATFWVPGWRNEDEPTDDPDQELSQIYHSSRRGLEERVMRVESGKSVTAMPLPRTTHFITNIVASSVEVATISVEANWMVQYFQPHRGERLVNFGDYELTLRRQGDDWLITHKRILLKNDLVPALLDFYML